MTELVPIVQSDLKDDLKELARVAVLTLASPHSRSAYSAAIERFAATGLPLDRTGVLTYLGELANDGKGSVTRNIHLSAVRLLAREAYERGLIDIETIGSLERIKTSKVLGNRTGNWLDLPGLKLLLQAAGKPPHGTRNRALIACMAGCGLRRAEVVSLDWAQWQQREGRWIWIDVKGKGGRVRSIPAPPWVASYVNDWKELNDQSRTD